MVALNIALLLFGSRLIAELIKRLPWLLDLAALVLAWTAAHMILEDIRLAPVLEHFPWPQFALPAMAFAIVIAADILYRTEKTQRHSSALLSLISAIIQDQFILAGYALARRCT